MVAFENRSAMYFQHSPEKLQTFWDYAQKKCHLQTLRDEIQPAFTRRQANPPASGTEPRPG